MLINNSKIIDLLWNNGVEVDEELDLNDPKTKDILSQIEELKFGFHREEDFFKKEGNNPSGYEQLIEVVKNCPNLRTFSFISFMKTYQDEHIDELFKEVVKGNGIRTVSFAGFKVNVNTLIESANTISDKTRVSVDKLSSIDDELKLLHTDIDTIRKVIISNHANSDLSTIFRSVYSGIIPLELYIKYKDYLGVFKDIVLSIENVSKLGPEKLSELAKDRRISGVKVKCGYTCDSVYTVSEYEQIRYQIDRIIYNIKMPSPNDPNREKIIFSQIYKILGQNIIYDDYAITEEGKEDEQLQDDCRTLKNGLLGVERDGVKRNLAVCAGYATILQNICSMFNIKCDYISSSSKQIVDPNTLSLRGVRKYENGTTDPKGHAYNAVRLDGKNYYCDLTWDASSLRLGKVCKNFLKSFDDFEKGHKSNGFSKYNVTLVKQSGETIYQLSDTEVYDTSYSLMDQIKLFAIPAKGQIEEMVNDSYLAGFVSEYLEHVKQTKSKVDVVDYLNIIRTVSDIEDYIFSDDFDKRMKNVSFSLPAMEIGDKAVSFVDPDKNADEIRNEVIEMDGGSWRMR